MKINYLTNHAEFLKEKSEGLAIFRQLQTNRPETILKIKMLTEQKMYIYRSGSLCMCPLNTLTPIKQRGGGGLFL